MKRIILGLIVILAGLCSTATAGPKVKLLFTTPDDDSKEVQDLITSRLNLTDRYAVVSDNNADIKIDVSCLRVDSTTSARRVCAISIYFWPSAKALLPFSTPDVIVGQPNFVADHAFIFIVNHTSDERIAEMWATFFESIEATCKANAKACSTLSASQVH